MELHLQKVLRSRVEPFFGDTDAALAELKELYGIKTSRHEIYPNLVLFKYSQVESPFSEPLVRECRGIILDEAANWDVVCYTFSKFWNHGEVLAAEIDWNTATVYEKLDGCLEYNTPVNIWGGGIEKIGRIVNMDLNPTLIGMNSEGNLVPSKIIGRKNNGRKERWLAVTTSAISKLQHGGHSKATVRMTPNHQVFANGVWVTADRLKPGDKLVSSVIGVDESVQLVVRASLLGDGSLCKNGNGAVFVEGHSTDQHCLSRKIASSLGSSFGRFDTRISGYGSELLRVATTTYANLMDLRNEWYVNGIKEPPADLSWIDDFTIAKWYMDDGSLVHSEKQQDRAAFATNGFSKDSVERLAVVLRKMYGVSVSLQDSKGCSIRVNAGRDSSIDKMWKRIAPYIIEGLAYKLPAKFRYLANTAEWPSGGERYFAVESEVLEIKEILSSETEFSAGACGYDIETSTQNFMIGNFLVHNSLLQMYHYDNEWRVATSGVADAFQNVGDFGLSFSELFWETFEENGLLIEKFHPSYCYSFELCAPENRVVVRHDKRKLFLHGARNLQSLQEVPAKELEYLAPVVPSYPLKNFEACIEATKTLHPLEHEGFVVCDADFNRVKIKSAAYLTLHHAKDGLLSRKKMAMVIRDGEASELEQALVEFPELRQPFDELKVRYLCLVKAANDNYEEIKGIQDQKEFATAAKLLPDVTNFMFSMRKNSVTPQAYMQALTEPAYLRLMGVKE